MNIVKVTGSIPMSHADWRAMIARAHKQDSSLEYLASFCEQLVEILDEFSKSGMDSTAQIIEHAKSLSHVPDVVPQKSAWVPASEVTEPGFYFMRFIGGRSVNVCEYVGGYLFPAGSVNPFHPVSDFPDREFQRVADPLP